MLKIKAGQRCENGHIITPRQAFRYNVRVEQVNRVDRSTEYDRLLTVYFDAIVEGKQMLQKHIWVEIMEDIQLTYQASVI